MCTAISTSALRLIPTLLAAVLLLLFSNCVIAERFQNSTVVPPDQIRSQCSVGLINKISIDVTVTNGPGLDGVYVLDFENYTKLANQFANTTTNKPDLRLASSADQTSSLFNYYIKPSCVADDKRITWCDNGDSSNLDRETQPITISRPSRICIVLSNANVTQSVTATIRAQLELVSVSANNKHDNSTHSSNNTFNVFYRQSNLLATVSRLLFPVWLSIAVLI